MRPLNAVVVALLIVSACSNDTSESATTSETASGNSSTAQTGEPAGTATFVGLEQTHVDTPVDYEQSPPVGGPHASAWQTCQFYDVEIPNERGVHSLEHGAVWITFDPALAAADIAVLAQFVEDGDEVLVSPFSGLPAPIVASAWGKQLQVDAITDPRLAEFVSYFDDGPQTPELNTPCAGGTTETD